MAYYSTDINANPHFTLRLVSPLLKAALQKQRYIELDNAFKMVDTDYTIGFDPQQWTFILQWSEEGEQHKQRIGVIAEPSNIPSLSGTYVYYFVCPQTGAKCRVLYKIVEGGFYGRKALKYARYALQMESKKLRYIHYPPEEKQPYKRYGKEYYKGKLTPYGRKCQRYEKAVERQEEAFYSDITKIASRWH